MALHGLPCYLFLGNSENFFLHDSYFSVCTSYHTWLKQISRYILKHSLLKHFPLDFFLSQLIVCSFCSSSSNQISSDFQPPSVSCLTSLLRVIPRSLTAFNMFIYWKPPGFSFLGGWDTQGESTQESCLTPHRICDPLLAVLATCILVLALSHSLHTYNQFQPPSSHSGLMPNIASLPSPCFLSCPPIVHSTFSIQSDLLKTLYTTLPPFKPLTSHCSRIKV